MIAPARFAVGFLLLLICLRASAANFVPSSAGVPEAPREFRGVWVASVANIDWPSKPGLNANDQKAELIAIFDRAVALRLNAVVLQVRANCDALYASKLEPWSEYLTGKAGSAPAPYYDPLIFAVSEAHERGLELHAWFNPYRASHISGKSPVARTHISKQQPQLLRKYGTQLWLDPGEKAVQEHSIKVIMDVVRRYDIDGVHIDDYFYPYPEKDSRGKIIDFPDSASWSRYRRNGGKLSRDDWRRENVNTFVQKLHSTIKAEKAWVKFGISPFGIWRPGNPPQIRGMDAFADLYADSRKWLMNGWLDYCSPQLYWTIEAPEQSFPVLLKWWTEQNPKQRHIWPGLSIARTSRDRPPRETINQIRLTRQQTSTDGNIMFSARALLQNREGLGDALLRDAYSAPALVPASTWLSAQIPPKPSLTVTESASGNSAKLSWLAPSGTTAWLWVLQTKVDGKWSTQIVPGHHVSGVLNSSPEIVAVSSVNRYGNRSQAVVLERQLSTGK